MIISSDNGLSPSQRQAIIWTNAGLMLLGKKLGKFWWKFEHIQLRKRIWNDLIICVCVMCTIYVFSGGKFQQH